GKLEFEVIIEHGLQAAKKPVVKDVADAAARTASTDSRYEDVDIDTWLGEADAVDRVRRLSDPETRQFRVDQIQQDESSKEDSQDMSVADESESKFKRPDRSGPKKLPASAKAAMTENSRDAAQDALKRHFGGR
ncbi:MAG: FHA domain-containing protein, partial [Planctomycetota bacterium]